MSGEIFNPLHKKRRVYTTTYEKQGMCLFSPGHFLPFPSFFPLRSRGAQRVRPLGVASWTLTFAPVSTRLL